jgi:tetratricopeptide (TPR) repeat protein
MHASAQRFELETKDVVEARSGETMVRLSVFAEKLNAHLDRQSVVKITNEITHDVQWATTDEKSQVELGLPFGKYEFEVSAVGFLTERKESQLSDSLNTSRMEFVLRRDPSAIDLNVSDEGMPAKARGDFNRGASALKSSNLKDAKKNLEAAYRQAPTNPDLNYLLGFMFYEQKDLAQAKNYLTASANLSPHNMRALTLLGRVELAREEYTAAAETLEKAVGIDSANWMAHNLLASAYLKLKKYDAAREQAELAITNGKAAANAANLVLGQALINLGKKEEGIKALQAFVQNSPTDPTAPQVRDLLAKLAQTDNAHLSGAAIAGKSEADIDPTYAAPELPASVNPWRPPGIDEAKPAVADGVSCPVDSVIERSGARVKELVDDVSRIAAIERLFHEQVNEMGKPLTEETRDYDYVASISENRPGLLAVDEDRSDRSTHAGFPDGIASGGFATLALVFHPDMRDNFEMTCEGLGSWHGQATWLVHFKQREDRPARMHDYRVGDVTYPVHLKGRAWITADKFEIVRIESELVGPMPQIQLRCEQQVVEYGPVRFQKNVELWLPQKAEIYLDFRKHRYYRSHSYDHYLLFSVDSVEKRNEPAVPPADPAQKPSTN